jgi:hypothetical protein
MVLAGLLALQLLLILLFRSPLGAGPGPAELRPLLPGLAAITPARIELGDGESRLGLVRGAEGWTVVEAGGYPADGAKVDDLISDLRGLEVRRPVATSDRYHGALSVAENAPEARVRVWEGPSGDPVVDLLVGTSPGYRSAHARREGESEVYEVRGLAAYDLRPDPGAWVQRELLDLPQERIVGLALRNSKGGFELKREEAGWIILGGPDESRQLDEEALDALLRSVSSLSLAEPVGPVDEAAQGLAEPAAVLTLRVAPPEGAAEDAGTETIELRVGREVPEETSHRYVTLEGSGFAVTVWASSLSRVLEQTLEDLCA